MRANRSFGLAFGVLAVAALLLQAVAAQAGIARGSFRLTPLVSDTQGLAPVIDPKLVNPWGLSSSATSPIWVADNNAAVSTLYNTAGQKVSLEVNIPGPGDPPDATTFHGTPTGTVFNPTQDFRVPTATGTAPSRFLFATEDGTVLGWAGGSKATIKVDNSGE